MPYERQFASKAAHRDIVANPEISAFLDDCEYLTPPSEDEACELAGRFISPPRVDEPQYPDHVIAIDGSYFESSKDDRLPNTRIGYVKVGGVAISMDDFGGLRAEDSRFIDPFKMAKLEDSNWPLTFPLPSSNVRLRGVPSVQESFRAIVDRHLFDFRTRFEQDDASTSLRQTLCELSALRPDSPDTATHLSLPRCPTCRTSNAQVSKVDTQSSCARCGNRLFPSDCLRLWEEVGEYQPNGTAISRFMNVVEHLLPVHYVRYLAAYAPERLAHLAFFIDGPLAVFGTSAWLHAAILRLLNDVNQDLSQRGYPPLLIIGLQKTGQVMDYFQLIERFLPRDRLLCIDDEFRYEYIVTGREPSGNGFGSETYYGQDFLYKTPTGRLFVFGLIYPFARKSEVRDFQHAKTELSRYTRLSDAIALIDHFETDLYENAVIPVALAHRYTAISLVPGGTVLNLLTAGKLGNG